VNALIAVSAFIAGVQTQIISFTLPLEQTTLARGVNTVAFVGLVLDVVGTFLGVIHAIVLQRRIKANTSILNSMAQVESNLKVIQNAKDTTQSTPEKMSEELQAATGMEDPDEHIRRAQELFRALHDHFQGRTVPRAFGLPTNVLHVITLANAALGIPDIKIETLAKNFFGLGHTPLFAMALGVVALIVSVIMFAAESTSLSSEVWVSCMAVLGGVIVLSLVPIIYEKLKDILSPGRSESFDSA